MVQDLKPTSLDPHKILTSVCLSSEPVLYCCTVYYIGLGAKTLVFVYLHILLYTVVMLCH